MVRASFVIPGDLSLPTGGYAYDRRVLALAGAHGLDLRQVAVPGSFPMPDETDIAATLAAIAAEPADSVVMVDGLAFGAMPGDAIARIKQDIVALVHHPLWLEAGLPEGRRIYLRQTERMALAFAERVIVTSPMTGRIVAEDFGYPPERIAVAEPGTDRAARARGGDGPPHLLAVGSIVPRKGYPVLIAALADLRDLPWRLTIAGGVRDEVEMARVRQIVEATGLGARITMAGAVTEGALDALYDSADIFVMPSLFEGYGMVLAEAMARGLPIVCTTGGAAAQTAPDAAARKVAPGKPDAFRDGLAGLLRDPALRRVMADASWAHGQTLPDWNETTARIAAVLRTVAARERSE
jgi:glycosyltransferase involved in cell wall biosynthesis